MQDTSLETQAVTVRTLRPEDLEAVIRLDAKVFGKRRDEYFKIKLAQNLAETGIKVSLAGEVDGLFVGFLLCRVMYGEFGSPEPVAFLDTLGVDPGFQRKGVGHALLEQLQTNLRGLGVNTLRSEVAWDDLDLLAFFQRTGFKPAARVCLDLEL
ncbi:MAG: GNAT family N-acetyltransferase [Planctomycetes bacterium]|nr:GNAT family N-acetyltransferase [Planctomycetota bacterium]